MIKSISFSNFKCFRDLRLNFVDGVNIISGSSDTGKTTVLRGLQWALFNRQQGKSTITHGEKSCSVEVELDDSTIRRGLAGNHSYSLDRQTFSAFRTTVPEPIAALVNMADINIQNRRDMPFMIAEKAGDVAARFSEMLDLEEISVSLANIDTEVTSQKRRRDALLAEQAPIQLECESLNWVDAAKDALDDIENREQELVRHRQEVETMTRLLRRFKDEFAAYDRLRGVVEAESELSQMELAGGMLSASRKEWLSWDRIRQRHDETAALVGRLAPAEAAHQALAGVLADVAQYRVEREQIASLARKLAHYGQEHQRLARLQPAVDAWEELGKLDKEAQALAQDARKCTETRIQAQRWERADSLCRQDGERYKQAVEAFTEAMPEVCPLCGYMTGGGR